MWLIYTYFFSSYLQWYIIVQKKKVPHNISYTEQYDEHTDLPVDWKTKSTTTEMYNHNKINKKTFENIVNINITETKIIISGSY